MNFYRKFLLFALILIAGNSQAIEVSVTTNKDSCVGLVFSILKHDTTYVTYKDLPDSLPPRLLEKPYYNRRLESRKYRVSNAFFSKLKAVEVFSEIKSQPLSKLNPKELYTFVVTDTEIRFASTSRSAYSPKNAASKHSLLAKDFDPVFYAGEAWFEDGVLIINHGSGTFKPKSEDLADIALYFQKVFEVEKVSFSDILPLANKKTLKDHLDDFKAYAMSKITNLEEMLVAFISRNTYKGQSIKLGVDGLKGNDIEFEVGSFVGSGFFGIIHKVKIVSFNEEAKKAYPQLFKDSEKRDDLVIKFPNNVPMLNALPSLNIFDQSIIRENDELKKLKGIMEEFHQDAADVVLKGSNEKPFLIKKFVKAASVQTMAKGAFKLSEEQIHALKRDIFEMALAVKKQLNLDLDIKAENIAWDAANKRFIMYEISIKSQSNGFYINNGFNGYLNYFNQQLQHYAHLRNPSKVGNDFPICIDNRVPVPPEFRLNFKSELFLGNIDLKKNALNISVNGIVGCFKVESVTYTDDLAFLNLRITDKADTKKQLDFVVQRNLSNEFTIRFMTFKDSKPSSFSIFMDANFQ